MVFFLLVCQSECSLRFLSACHGNLVLYAKFGVPSTASDPATETGETGSDSTGTEATPEPEVTSEPEKRRNRPTTRKRTNPHWRARKIRSGCLRMRLCL
jgi:hypothetical protein